jgi:hypothetical protein
MVLSENIYLYLIPLIAVCIAVELVARHNIDLD